MSEQPFRKKQLMYGIKTRKFLTLDEANKRRRKKHILNLMIQHIIVVL